MPDPFPNELVEAAAMAVRRSLGIGVDDDVEYAVGSAVLAAVLPLIEQRVIDRLAGEAGENPYRDLSMPLLSEACKIEAEVWDAGAACGVAAERARTWEIITAYGSPDGFVQKASLLAALAPERTTGEGT